MKMCANCEHEKDDAEMYSPAWCKACVEATLNEQERDMTDRRVRPQVFHA